MTEEVITYLSYSCFGSLGKALAVSDVSHPNVLKFEFPALQLHYSNRRGYYIVLACVRDTILERKPDK